jgi:hypothetical protein
MSGRCSMLPKIISYQINLDLRWRLSLLRIAIREIQNPNYLVFRAAIGPNPNCLVMQAPDGVSSFWTSRGKL